MSFKLWRYPKSQSMQPIEQPQRRVYLEGQLTDDMQLNLQTLKDVFGYPDNMSLKIRNIHIRATHMDANILYIESAADAKAVEENIIKPLLEMDNPPTSRETEDLICFIQNHLLSSASLKETDLFGEVVEQLLEGNCILLIANYSRAVIAETQGFQYRSVSTPDVEQAIRGPREAFIESAEVNRSLIRKYLRNYELQCEMVSIGRQTNKKVFVMYMRNIANDAIVNRIKKRIHDVRNDHIENLFMLEQMIEERPYSLIPSVLITERPDRVASFLLEGHVAVIMENSPNALIAPITFWNLFHAAEDQYLRWINGNFLRIIRLFAIFCTMLIPALYVAITTFHVEMLPTDLMLAISASRERVPFPVIVEIMFMEFTFELIRESGIRVPAPIGSTIGIVGALVLGQAAVDANLVSPILVIIVAITGIASFIMPDISLNFSIRVQRFIFIIFGSCLGFFGIGLYMTFAIAYIVSFKSFGVPFLSPLAPALSSAGDVFFRNVLWKQWFRPANLSPKDPKKEEKPEGK